MKRTKPPARSPNYQAWLHHQKNKVYADFLNRKIKYPLMMRQLERLNKIGHKLDNQGLL